MKDFLFRLSTLSDAKKALEDLFTNDSYAQFWLTAVKRGKKRSISMNRQQHLFYAQIAKYYGDRTALEVKCQCKDMFGLPILHNSEHSSEQIEYLTHGLQYYKGSYERRMKLIQCLSVTSLFTTAESKQYCEHMIYYYNDLGVMIKFKES